MVFSDRYFRFHLRTRYLAGNYGINAEYSLPVESVSQPNIFFNTSEADEDDDFIDDEYVWAFNNIRNELLKYGDKDFVVNTLIAYCYTVKKYSNKKLLWACFGKEIVGNLEKNTKDLGKICPICGKRFFPKRGEQDIYCSDTCSKKHRKMV